VNRYRVIALHGATNTMGERPDERLHAVQEGGAGGRIIGGDWRLGRGAAEALAAELERARQSGCEQRVRS
jgi:hypothetical protein